MLIAISKDVEKGIEIGKTWKNQILRICDDHFFYEQVKTPLELLSDNLNFVKRDFRRKSAYRLGVSS